MTKPGGEGVVSMPGLTGIGTTVMLPSPVAGVMSSRPSIFRRRPSTSTWHETTHRRLA